MGRRDAFGRDVGEDPIAAMGWERPPGAATGRADHVEIARLEDRRNRRDAERATGRAGPGVGARTVVALLAFWVVVAAVIVLIAAM